MTRAANEYERADRERDLRKHDSPARGRMIECDKPAEPPRINAVEIAVLVKGMKNITEAATLIDQYAACVAAGARLEGVEEAYARMNAVFDGATMLKREDA